MKTHKILTIKDRVKTSRRLNLGAQSIIFYLKKLQLELVFQFNNPKLAISMRKGKMKRNCYIAYTHYNVMTFLRKNTLYFILQHNQTILRNTRNYF